MELEVKIEVKSLRDAVKLTAYALTAAAILKELRKPPSERQWRGDIIGIPYDFRVPTLERVRNAYWNPNDPRVFTPNVFGLGWAINIPALERALVRLGRQVCGETGQA